MKKKIGLICLVFVLALGTVGVGYATWTDTLNISGTVNTGELDWEWTGCSSIDPGPPNVVMDYHCNDGFVAGPLGIFWQGTKDVGYTDCEITDSHTVTVTMHNIYPSYFGSISVYAMNTGTIPLKFERVIISSDYDTYILDWIPPPSYAPVLLDCTGEGDPDIEIKWGNHIGIQLEPDEETPEISFWIHLFEAAPQGAPNLTFTLELEAIQYNASIHP